MRIAIVTSNEKKEWYEDINLLISALKAIKVVGECVVWNDERIDWSAYDVVLIDSVWDYTEHYIEFLNWCKFISTQSKLINSYEIIKLSSNKNYLLKLQESHLRTPLTEAITASNFNDSSIVNKFTGSVVMKPVIGASGVDTILFKDLKTAINSPLFAKLAADNACLIQEYVPEIKNLGEIGAVYIDGKLSHCVLKKPADIEFRVQHQYGGTAELARAPAQTDELYRDVIETLGIKPTYMRLDFIPAPTPIIMEVEMIEPHKYFTLCPEGAIKLAKSLIE